MKIYISILFLVASVLQVSSAFGQELDAAEVKQMLEGRKFEFIPQTVSPMSGGTRQLTTEYSLKVSGDTLISFLPYFGRAYSISPGDKGLDFQSTSFEMKIKQKKKRSWEIMIRPKDHNDVRLMQLTIHENGQGTLFVNSLNRQPIRYYGGLRRI